MQTSNVTRFRTARSNAALQNSGERCYQARLMSPRVGSRVTPAASQGRASTVSTTATKPSRLCRSSRMISGETGKGQNGTPILTAKSVMNASVVSRGASSAAAGTLRWMLCRVAPSQRCPTTASLDCHSHARQMSLLDC